MTQKVDAVDFPETPWSLLARQAAGVPEDQNAMRELLQLYWQPVFCAIRDGWRITSSDAGSLCDQFLAEQLSPQNVAATEPRSRFRLHLKSELIRFMGSDPQPDPRASLSGVSIDTTIAAEQVDGEPENVFDERWMLVVFRQALERTRDRLSDAPDAYDALVRTDVEPSDDATPVADDDHNLRLARTSFRRELVELVYQSVSSLDDAREELRWLLG